MEARSGRDAPGAVREDIGCASTTPWPSSTLASAVEDEAEVTSPGVGTMRREVTVTVR
jgi:hypothetical protein